MRADKTCVRKRFARGVAWTLLASVLSQGTVCVCSVISARLLGKEQFGELGIIQSTVCMAANLAGFGLSSAATKYASELRSFDTAKLGRILGLCQAAVAAIGALGALLLFIAAPFVARGAFHAPQLTSVLRWAAPYVLFSTMNSYQVATLIGLEAFGTLAAVNLVQSATCASLTLVLTSKAGLQGAAAAVAISAATAWVFHQVALRSRCRHHGLCVTRRESLRELRLLSGFVLPAATSTAICNGAIWAGNALLVRNTGGFSEMAMFNAANVIRTVYLYFPGLIARVSAPILCNVREEGGSGQFRRAFVANARLCLLVAVVSAPLFYLASPYLLAMFGRQFTGGNVMIAVMLASGVAEVMGVALYQALYSHGKLWWHVLIVLPWSVLLVSITALESARYGALALASSYLAAWSVAAALYWAVSRKLTVTKRPAPEDVG